MVTVTEVRGNTMPGPPLSHRRKRIQLRHICFTTNNPKYEDYLKLYQLVTDATLVKYAIIGLEKAPTTGTEHLQGYISFTGVREFNVVKASIPTGSHIEAAKGDAKANQAYCSKEGDYQEFGTLPQPGKRGRLELATTAIKEGKPMVEIAQEFPEQFVRYYRGFRELETILKPQLALERERPQVSVYVGLSGTGKSRRAMDEAIATGTVYEKMAATGKWWPRFNGQKCVIFNDYYGEIPYAELLSLLDRYGGIVEQKNGDCVFNATHIWFTSNKHVNTWYPKQDDMSALFRRITKYETMDAMGAPPRDYSNFCLPINC